MEHKLLLKLIDNMDATAEEFCELVNKINEKYFDIEDPDEYQKSAQLLNLILHRAEEDQVIVLVKIYSEIFKLMEQKMESITATLELSGGFKIYFQAGTTPTAIDKLQKQLLNTVLVKSNQIDSRVGESEK